MSREHLGSHPADDGEPATIREAMPALFWIVLPGLAGWIWLACAVPLLWFIEAFLASIFVSLWFASQIYPRDHE